jgi:hypothetical protein
MTLRLADLCFGVSTAFTITLLALFVLRRDAHVPLSYRAMFNGWADVRALFQDAPSPVTQGQLDSVTWCPMGQKTSSQCACFQDYLKQRYLPDVAFRWNATTPSPLIAQIGQNHSEGILSSCLRKRPSWRKESCGNFCSVHLSTPILLANLYMCILFSTVSQFHTVWLPLLLSILTIGFSLGLDHDGGVVSSLSVLSVITDLYIFGPKRPWDSQIFWSYHRFLCSALAVWAGVTHQARDIYLVAAYGVLGFFAGFMSYAVYLVKLGVPCRHSGSVCLYLYLGIGAVTACFIILVQQHWFSGGVMRSSSVSVPLLSVALIQCLGQTPYHAPPIQLNLLISLALLVFGSLAAISDLY